jgi:hypothetical protein
MAALAIGNDSSSTYLVGAKNRMATSVNQSTSVMLQVPPSAELALIEQYPPLKFSTFQNLKKIVASQKQKLSTGDENETKTSISLLTM